MEPVTHFLTGAVLARAGFNRKAAYATLAMTLAAEAPDLDTLWSIRGPVAAFQHHRGWTHTFLGIPFEAAIVLGVIYLGHRICTRRKPLPNPNLQPTTRQKKAPIRWPLLYAFIVVALLSHLLLDWTNNYGLRPFFPFNPHWYAGSFVFIFEPVMFLFLLIALIAPALFGLINSEVGASKPLYRGRGWAIFALIAIAALWSFRAYQHQQALNTALTADYNGAPVSRAFASPHPINPWRWSTVVETPTFFQTANVNTLTGELTTDTPSDVYFKPPTTLATLIAKRSWLGRAYLDWSQWPLVQQVGNSDTGTDPEGNTTVTFHDLRFMYDTTLFTGRTNPPLTGTVIINADHRVSEMKMDKRIQH